MKKIFTLLTAMLLAFGINADAQSRKTWDFTKGFEASRAILDADNAKWGKGDTDENGLTGSWTSNASFTGELTATVGGEEVVVPDLAGLYFSDFGSNNAVVINNKYKRVRLQKKATVTIKGVEAGEIIKFTAQSANAKESNRGFVFNGAATTDGETTVMFLGGDLEGGGLKTIELIAAGGDVSFVTGASGVESGLDIYSIVIGEGDKNIKTWDFTKWSDATVAQICGAEDWTTAESDAKNYIEGNEIRWIATDAQFDANGDLTAGGEAIKEMKGLKHEGVGKYGLATAFDYQTTTDGNNWGPYTSPAYLWVMTTGSTITIPNVKGGSTLKLGVESHKPGDSRGFEVKVNGATIATLKAATAEKEDLECVVPDGEGEYVDVTLKATKGVHLYYIEAEVKDEAAVDRNPYLGAPALSIKDGSRISLKTEGLTITFPKAKNMEGDTEITLEGWFGPTDEAGNADYGFDGITGNIMNGVVFPFSDYLELEENTSYTFYITKMEVAEPYEKFTQEGDDLCKITFATKGPGIQEAREWADFKVDAEGAAALKASVDGGHGYWNASSKGRYSYAKPIVEQPLMLNDETPFPTTDGLIFSMASANDILIGTPDGNNGRLQLGGGSPSLIIPTCSAGDEVTVTMLYGDKSKHSVTLINGTCEGETTINVANSSAQEYKIIVTEDGDLELRGGIVVYQKISIFPASSVKETINYSIVAQTSEGETLATLAEGQGETNDKVDVAYSYWLAGQDGKLYTYGAKGSPFTTSVVLETGQEVYPIVYKDTEIEGVVFCAEAEELEGAEPVTHANSAIRSSKGTAAFTTEDIKLCTLQPGTYKIEAVIFDGNKTPGHIVKFTVGEQEVELACTATNFDDVTSDLIEVTEECDVTWIAGGGANTGLDCVVIYASEDKPEVPGDVDGDGEVDTTDLNLIIDKILGENVEGNTDIDGNGVTEVLDLNLLIDIILGGE